MLVGKPEREKQTAIHKARTLEAGCKAADFSGHLRLPAQCWSRMPHWDRLILVYSHSSLGATLGPWILFLRMGPFQVCFENLVYCLMP